MTIFTIHHKKGGVGKTTTAQHLSIASALAGIQTLAIDTDSQGNLSKVLQAKHFPGTGELFESIIKDKEVSLTDHIVKVNTNLYVMPSTPALLKAETEITNYPGHRYGILNTIKPLLAKEGFQAVLVDTPPQSGWVVGNAIVIADKIVAPVECESFSVDGLAGLMQELHNMGKYHHETPFKLSAIVPTKFNNSRKGHKKLLEDMKAAFNNLVTHTIIRVDANIETAQAMQFSLFEYDTKSRAIQDYKLLFQELFLGGTQ